MFDLINSSKLALAQMLPNIVDIFDVFNLSFAKATLNLIISIRIDCQGFTLSRHTFDRRLGKQHIVHFFIFFTFIFAQKRVIILLWWRAILMWATKVSHLYIL